MALAPVKVVLKSTTTKTLNDRFTEMVHHKSPGSNRQSKREEMIDANRASAKNRRLAEQMSRRSGLGSSAVMDKEDNDNKKSGGNIKNRIDRSRLKSDVKDRLGVQNSNRGGRGAGSIQNRLGTVRRDSGIPANVRNGRSNIRGRSPSKRGLVRGQMQSRGGRGRSDGRNNLRSSPGRGQGRGGGRRRGRGRGRGGRGGAPNRNNLDSELDNYMSETK